MRKLPLSAAIAALPLIVHAPAVTAEEQALPEVKVHAHADASASAAPAASDTTRLLDWEPGVSTYTAGGVSALPVIHGMADDRLRVKVDGMDLIASCPNHMNSPLSYVAPSAVSTLKVYAGITPVSAGGDSIGGTIIANTAAPVFAKANQGVLTTGEAGAYYRSNGNAQGANLSATVATESFSATYSGATAKADDYRAGRDFKTVTATKNGNKTLSKDVVGSTAYDTRNHLVRFALKGDQDLVEAQFGYQDIPYELYPNQRMDMLANKEHRTNLSYLGQRSWGTVEARIYRETVDHYMDFGQDKQFLYTAGNTTQGMPMRTEGVTNGASAKLNIDLSQQDVLRVGTEYQHYQLNDYWPAVIGSMGMGPNDFVNINNGKRDRTALFGEWEQRLNSQWQTLAGLRLERVDTDAGAVHGYNQTTAPYAKGGMDMMNQIRDAVPFNNAARAKSDNNWDLTALARYGANAESDYEFGYARKVRSPNLYERYSWSTANMMSIMNNFVGDGNGYIGNLNLKPEVAHTLSVTGNWHSADRSYELKATPYYTYVTNYIDAVQWNGTTNAQRTTLLKNQFVVLKYMNQSAEFYGLDISGRMPLGETHYGDWGLKGLLNYTRGKNLDTDDNLYNVMPLNAKLTVTQTFGGWDNGIEFVGVAKKNDVSATRNEIKTPGYSLVNLRASYSWKQMRLDFGVENLFDKGYALPLGGAYTGQGTTMSINTATMPWGVAVAGMGRSLYTALNYKF